MVRRNKNSGCGTIIWILIIFGIIGSFLDKDKEEINSSVNIENKVNDETSNNAELEEDIESENVSEEAEPKENCENYEEKEASKTENEFIGDDIINQLLIEYNQNAEFKITADDVKNGAYYENAIASCNGVYVMIYNSNDIFVDLSIEDLDDSHIYPVFRDFMKTLDLKVTNDDIYSGWCDLLTGKYTGYNYRNIGDVQCLCWVNKVNNGKLSYTIKTGCKTYKN